MMSNGTSVLQSSPSEAFCGAECIALIKPSAATPYDLVVAAHEACAQAGLTRSGVAPPDAAASGNKAPISPT